MSGSHPLNCLHAPSRAPSLFAELVDRLVLLDGAKDAAFESMAREAEAILQQEDELIAAEEEQQELEGDGCIGCEDLEERQHRQLEIMAAQVRISAPALVPVGMVRRVRVVGPASTTQWRGRSV